MKIKLKTKKNLRKVLSMILCGVLIMGAVFGAVAIGKKVSDKTKAITPKFFVGSLGEKGQYVVSKASIYTKDYFECKGLVVNLDFDSSISYRIFYYDADNNFISSTSTHFKSIEADVPVDAVYARMMITPIWDATIPLEKQVCHWYDTYKYSRQMEIRVLKEQDKETSLLDTWQVTEVGYGREDASVGSAPVQKEGYTTTTTGIELKDTTAIELRLPATGVVRIHFYDSEGRHLHVEEISSPTNDAIEVYTFEADAGYHMVHFEFSLINGVEITDYEVSFRND